MVVERGNSGSGRSERLLEGGKGLKSKEVERGQEVNGKAKGTWKRNKKKSRKGQ